MLKNVTLLFLQTLIVRNLNNSLCLSMAFTLEKIYFF